VIHRGLGPRGENNHPVVGYSDWRQVAGFFDGDGLVKVDPGKFVLALGLRWDDNYKQQIEQLAAFLDSRGIRHGKIIKSGGAWHVLVKRLVDVRKVSRNIARFSFKKRNELIAVLDYLENRITGDQVSSRLNGEVRRGNRLGDIRRVRMPYKRGEGKRRFAARRAKNLRRLLAILSPEQAKEIRKSHFHYGVRIKELAKLYGVSKATIERALYR
jgi:hypothetical protein